MPEILIKQATVAERQDVVPGQRIDVSVKTARELIACGFAVPVGEDADRDMEAIDAGGPVAAPPLFARSNEDGTHELSGKSFPKKRR